jgi:hypothetical protein
VTSPDSGYLSEHHIVCDASHDLSQVRHITTDRVVCLGGSLCGWQGRSS